MRRTIHLSGVALLHLLLALGVFLMAAPFVWMVGASFKPQFEIFRNPPLFIPQQFQISNYTGLFEQYAFFRHFRNSLFLASAQSLLQLFFCSLAGYAFAKYEFKLKNILFLVLLGSMMIPSYTTFVPLFVLIIKLRLVDTYAGVLLPGIVSAFGIFFMRQNMQAVPNELLDAGRIDGTSEFGTFWRIALPLVRPALGVLGALTFLGSWNDFVWPLVVLRTRELQTLPVVLASLVGTYKMEYGMVMAGAFLSSLPMLILFGVMQRQFIRGLTVGALHG